MKDELPAIAKAAVRVVVSIDAAVSRFSRANKYTIGADLRTAARAVSRLTMAAWHDQRRKLQRVHELSSAVDDLKLEIIIADGSKAFGSDKEMEAVGRLVHELGKQVGGWLKALHSKGQSAATERQPQRARILSARSASTIGANP